MTTTDSRRAAATTGERADLVETLRAHRAFLRQTARDLTDEQAAQRTTVSELTVGGLIKHVAATEAQWAEFIVRGTEAMPDFSDDSAWTEDGIAAYAAGFRMQPGETLDGLLGDYDEVARRTDDLVVSLPDLDASHRLPDAPWTEPGKHWSARRTFLHIVAETAQHAGHADIIRESLDGAKTMG